MKVLLVGGGSGGHVYPLIAVANALKDQDSDCSLCFVTLKGDHFGVEEMREMGVFYQIHSGKLQRYFDVRTFLTPFKLVLGFFQSFGILLKERPNVVFSKGGFVSVPMAAAAYIQGVPIVTHECDAVTGLANKMIQRLSKVVCHSLQGIEGTVLTGNPIRREILHGKRERGLKRWGLSADRPVLFVFGGSQGSVAINELVREVLAGLTEHVQVLHQVGKGNMTGATYPGYVELEFLKGDEMADAFAVCDLVVMRAGLNSLMETSATSKPMVLIPLPTAANNHQVHNARTWEKAGAAMVFDQHRSPEDLKVLILNALKQGAVEKIGEKAREMFVDHADQKIAELVVQVAI